MKKIRLFNVLIIIAFLANNAYAQDTVKSKRNLVAGYTSGITLAPGLFPNNKPTLCCQGYTQGMYLRRYINEHIAIETSISYFKSPSVPGRSGTNKSSGLVIPITAQYNLLPKKKLHPYFGVGVAYISQQIAGLGQQGTDKPISAAVKNNNIALQYDQGILYQVNTKIEIKESIHIIPENQNACFGLELGIGFNL